MRKRKDKLYPDSRNVVSVKIKNNVVCSELYDFLEIEHRNDNKLLLYNVIIGERKKKFDGKGSLQRAKKIISASAGSRRSFSLCI